MPLDDTLTVHGADDALAQLGIRFDEIRGVRGDPGLLQVGFTASDVAAGRTATR